MKKNTIIVCLSFLASCSFNGLSIGEELHVIESEKKAAVFQSAQSKLGEVYSNNNAHFVYSSLKDALGEGEIPLFEDTVTVKNIFDITQPYRSSIVDDFFQPGDIVFLNTQTLVDSTIGFADSYDFSKGTVSYIAVINNQISLKTVRVDKTKISFRQLTTKK